MTDETATNRVQTTQMTLRIIEGLEELRGGTLTEIANHLEEPKSTVYNHLSTLAEANYVVRQANMYHLGLRFTELGEQSRNRYPAYVVGNAEIENLAEETGELVNLAVEENGDVVYLARARGEKAISTDTFAGKRVSMHCTSLGKAMLAFMPDERVKEIVSENGLPPRTERTFTDQGALIKELATIREEGVAFDDQERGHGIRCVAAPIVQREEQRVMGAVSISGPVNRLTNQRFTDEIPELVRGAANIIEIELMYSERIAVRS